MASKAKIIRRVVTRSTHEQEIRIHAYEIYLQRGGQTGNELEDWLQAERELTAGTPFTRSET
jgi:hypothetical protein